MIRHIVQRAILILATVIVIAMLTLLISNGQQAAAQPGLCFERGDIFAAVGQGKVNWFRPDGTFVGTLDTGQYGEYNAGMAFDAKGNLYVTNFSDNSVTMFDRCGKRLQIIPTGGVCPESIAVDCKNGYFYVGHACADGDIRKYDWEWNPVDRFDVETDRQGTDWIDLAADRCTMLYTSEGRRIMQYNVCEREKREDFALLPGVEAFELRILPDGGVLVGDTEAIYQLDSTGAISDSYDDPDEPRWRNLSLDPDSRFFWGGGWDSNIYKFRFGTPTPISDFLIDPKAPTDSVRLRGLAVCCEPSAAGCDCPKIKVDDKEGGPTIPEPGTLTLLGLGLAGLAGYVGRQRRVRRRHP